MTRPGNALGPFTNAESPQRRLFILPRAEASPFRRELEISLPVTGIDHIIWSHDVGQGPSMLDGKPVIIL